MHHVNEGIGSIDCGVGRSTHGGHLLGEADFEILVTCGANFAAEAEDGGVAGVAPVRQIGDRQVDYILRAAQDILPHFPLLFIQRWQQGTNLQQEID